MINNLMLQNTTNNPPVVILLALLAVMIFLCGSPAKVLGYEIILTVDADWDAAGTTDREKAFFQKIK